jgi:hypothetical protein
VVTDGQLRLTPGAKVTTGNDSAGGGGRSGRGGESGRSGRGTRGGTAPSADQPETQKGRS